MDQTASTLAANHNNNTPATQSTATASTPATTTQPRSSGQAIVVLRFAPITPHIIVRGVLEPDVNPSPPSWERLPPAFFSAAATSATATGSIQSPITATASIASARQPADRQTTAPPALPGGATSARAAAAAADLNTARAPSLPGQIPGRGPSPTPRTHDRNCECSQCDQARRTPFLVGHRILPR